MKWLVAAALIWLVWRLLGPTRPPARSERDSARAVLGVARGADAEAIRAAHRRLIAGVHPDRGGSAELTRRVNAARDLLLRDAERP